MKQGSDLEWRRIEKRAKDGDISRYVYDGRNMVAEYNGANTLVANYVQGFGIDQPISMYRGGEMYWYHKDVLGSIYQMTDEDETVARTYDYSAFGTIISETGTLSNPFTYTAREFDSDSGLYYYRARYYDSSEGRFLSRDPIHDINLYPYAKNNPLNRIDPSGMKDCYNECISKMIRRCWTKSAVILLAGCLIGCVAAGPLFAQCFALCMTVGFNLGLLGCASDLIDCVKDCREEPPCDKDCCKLAEQ